MTADDARSVAVARAQLGAGRPLRTRAAGQSMWPLLREGAEVVVVPLTAAPAVGDVVLLVLGGRLVLHRVVRVLADGAVVTKGDAELGADPPVAAADLLGRVARAPWDGLVGRASAAPLGGIALWLGLARRAASRARGWRRGAK
ncbi:MAG: S24/S26 family peptidase [Deltaproteobacteria bacterium]|nr:S24/S26 family peptidase [Deltaproteobacteria bacterium]